MENFQQELASFVTINEKSISFGQLASSYAAGRKEYPEEVFTLLSQHISKQMRVLELGCGTGLATKQLYERGFHNLVATDIDSLMLQEARRYCPSVVFELVDANQLPFSEHSFDAILLFGCFHWFCTQHAINEMKKVLKSQGMILIVNKNDIGSFRNNFVQFLQEVCGEKIQEGKALYKPQQTIVEQGFSVAEHIFYHKELYTRKQLKAYCQSISLWSSLPVEKQTKYLPFLESFLDHLMEDDYFERIIEVRCLVCHQNL